MEYNELISVVIPTFNRQDTIIYCLNSVLEQTYKNLEVIVVDDCSTDDTVKTVRNCPDPRVRCVVLEKNSGAQKARNRGIKEAKGDWIAFHDSDDEWLPEKIERQVSELANESFDPWCFVYCNAYRYDKTKGLKHIRMLPVVEGEDKYSTLLQSPAPLFPTIITSKAALEKIGYLDEKVPSFQEWDTSIRLAKYCKIAHIKEPLMIYNVGSNDAISGNAKKHVEGLNYIISKYKNEIKNNCGESVWTKLTVQLLGTCLDSGLVEYYDHFQKNGDMIRGYRLIMFYIKFCRRWQVKPSNVFYRIFRKLFQISNHFGFEQGKIVEHV